MISEIRKKLDKVTGELIESFVNFNKERVLHFQAGLFALDFFGNETGKKHNLFTIKDEKMLEKLLAEHGVSQEDYKKIPNALREFEEGRADAAETIKHMPLLLQEAVKRVNERGSISSNIPTTGMIAVSLNEVKIEVKNSLLAGRSAEKALQAVERSYKVQSSIYKSKDKIFLDRLYDFSGNGTLARSYIGRFNNDPDYLIFADSLHHIADMLEGNILLKPDIINEHAVKESLEGIKMLAGDVFWDVYSRLNREGEEKASEDIKNLASHISSSVNSNKQEYILKVRKGIEHSIEEINTNRLISQKEYQDFKDLVSERLKQMEKVF